MILSFKETVHEWHPTNGPVFSIIITLVACVSSFVTKAVWRGLCIPPWICTCRRSLLQCRSQVNDMYFTNHWFRLLKVLKTTVRAGNKLQRSCKLRAVPRQTVPTAARAKSHYMQANPNPARLTSLFSAAEACNSIVLDDGKLVEPLRHSQLLPVLLGAASPESMEGQVSELRRIDFKLDSRSKCN